MSRKEGRKEFQNEARFRDIPAWARDNLVLKLLDDKGFRIKVVYDEKYLNGLCKRPLIVIRRKRVRRDTPNLDS